MSKPVSAPPMDSRTPASGMARAGSPGRPKDLAKRAAVLEAAKELFVHNGYEGVSMDQIAAAAGVSKLTVYSHFGDKDTLFVEAARLYCQQKVPETFFEPAPNTPLRERLLDIAETYFRLATSPQALSGHRLLCSPQMVEKRLSQLFWKTGPVVFQQAMVELLQRRVDAGELEVDDLTRAGAHFFALVRGELHTRLVFGCGEEEDCGEQAVRAHLESAVDLFMRAHAKR